MENKSRNQDVVEALLARTTEVIVGGMKLLLKVPDREVIRSARKTILMAGLAQERKGKADDEKIAMASCDALGDVLANAAQISKEQAAQVLAVAGGETSSLGDALMRLIGMDVSKIKKAVESGEADPIS